jgi:hypothetical protein
MRNLTKRGNSYHNRCDKKSTGFSKVVADQKAKCVGTVLNSTLNSLAVKGTCDRLGSGNWLYFKTVTIEHPTDKGYFKKVKRLSDKGRSKLERLKNKKYHKKVTY